MEISREVVDALRQFLRRVTDCWDAPSEERRELLKLMKSFDELAELDGMKRAMGPPPPPPPESLPVGFVYRPPGPVEPVPAGWLLLDGGKHSYGSYPELARLFPPDGED